MKPFRAFFSIVALAMCLAGYTGVCYANSSITLTHSPKSQTSWTSHSNDHTGQFVDTVRTSCSSWGYSLNKFTTIVSSSHTKPSSFTGQPVSGVGSPSSVRYVSIYGERYVHAESVFTRILSATKSKYVRGGIYRWEQIKPRIVSVNPSSRSAGTSNISVSVTYADTNGYGVSGVNFNKYQWVQSTSRPNHPGAGSIGNSKSGTSRTITQTGNGTWWLHLAVYDRAGNTQIGTYGPYVKTGSSGGAPPPPSNPPPPGGGNPPGPPQPPQQPLPSVSANPPNRAWSQADVSVALSFANTTSQRARWGSGSWTSASLSSSRTMKIDQSGSWTLRVEASGPGGSVSPSFGLYRIDKVRPTIRFTPADGCFTDTGAVGIRFRDEHSGIRRVRWVWSQSSDSHPGWSWVSRSGNAVNESVQLPGYGVWWLHAEVEDNVGLKRYAVGGPYVVMNELETPAFRRWVRLIE